VVVVVVGVAVGVGVRGRGGVMGRGYGGEEHGVGLRGAPPLATSCQAARRYE
jgi:hypothetical protein